MAYRSSALLFVALATINLAWCINLTGNAKADFSVDNALLSDRQKASLFSFDKTNQVTCGDWMAGASKPGNPYAAVQPEARRSGMDMDAVHMMYDDTTDRLYIGIQCGAICGDIDGDGNPSGTDPNAGSEVNLGTDIAGMCESELFSWMLWNNPPSNYDPYATNRFYPNIIVGLRLQDCLVNEAGQTELRAYEFTRGSCQPNFTTTAQSPACTNVNNAAGQTGQGFGPTIVSKYGLPPLVIDPHKSLYLNSTYPHVEFYLPNWSQYPTFNTWDAPQAPYVPGQETQPGQSHFRLAFKAKSAAVDDCGEDTVSPQLWEIKWDCAGWPNGNATYDVCGDCAGPGLRCLDCFGVPNGTAKYDDCGVCNGTNLSCQDCFHVPYGPAKYDECGVCDGDNSSCWDCAYVPNGLAVYDACGVCDGDNSSCWDCAYVPNGPSKYDACGVCDGDNTTCDDCFGVPHGPAVYDACGVCGGDNTTCDDCFGVPYGPAVYDACGVCDGDNTTCDDCFGVPHGPAVYDACGVCDGDNTTCDDCFGVPHGTALVDACGICGGDNTTCDDCDGVPHGDAKYDRCGVCNGDNSTCTCYRYLGWEAPELCHGLLRWSIAASRVKLTDTLDVLYAIKNELPYLNWKGAGAFLPNYLDTVHMFCEECLDNFDYAQAWFADRLAGNCIGANCEDLAVDQMSWQL